MEAILNSSFQWVRPVRSGGGSRRLPDPPGPDDLAILPPHQVSADAALLVLAVEKSLASLITPRQKNRLGIADVGPSVKGLVRPRRADRGFLESSSTGGTRSSVREGACSSVSLRLVGVSRAGR